MKGSVQISNRDIALEFLRCFCEGDISGLEPLLAPDMKFEGPMHAFDSAAAYLERLRQDPPVRCGYKVLCIAEDNESVAVFYDYCKSGKPMKLAQLFTIRELQIHGILLVFDTAALS
jgi:hypothetical protein